MKTHNAVFPGLMLLVCLLAFSSTSLASHKKTPESCANLGALRIQCFECKAGMEKYVGDAAVMAMYELDQGKEYCVKSSVALDACKRAYNINEVGYFAQYWMGLTRKDELYRKNCVDMLR